MFTRAQLRNLARGAGYAGPVDWPKGSTVFWAEQYLTRQANEDLTRGDLNKIRKTLGFPLTKPFQQTTKQDFREIILKNHLNEVKAGNKFFRAERRVRANVAIERFETRVGQQVNSTREFFDAIIEEMKRIPGYTSVRLRFTNQQGDVLWRNTPLAVDAHTYEEFRAVVAQMGVNVQPNEARAIFGDVFGSDRDELDGHVMSLDWFAIVAPVLAGGAPKIPIPSHKNKNTRVVVRRGYITQDFRSKNNNCLLEIFRATSKVNRGTSSALRKLLANPRDRTRPLNLRDIPVLEAIYQTKVVVLLGARYRKVALAEGDRTSRKRSNLLKFKTQVEREDTVAYGSTQDAKLWILLDEAHFSLIVKPAQVSHCKHCGVQISARRVRASDNQILAELMRQGRLDELKPKKRAKTKKEAKPKKYWFFDYETVYDSFGELHPYAVACVYGSMHQGGFEQEGAYFHAGSGVNPRFVKWLQQTRDDSFDNVLIGYNSSRFDNFILLSELLARGAVENGRVFCAGNTLLGLKFLSFDCRDLCRFLMMPLKTACVQFGCELGKESFDHNEIQDMYFLKPETFYDRIATMVKENPKLETYNTRDVTCLAELYHKVRKASLEMNGADIDDYQTISQMSYQVWLKTVGKGSVNSPVDKETWQNIRKSIVAGRAQVFKKGHFQGPFQSYDVKSLYPYVMEYCDFPLGKDYKVKEQTKGRLGVFHCRITNQPKDNVIPHRTRDKPLDWFYEKPINTWLTSVDIDCLKDFNANVEFLPFDEEGHTGIEWTEKGDAFGAFLRPLREDKTKQDRLRDALASGRDPEFVKKCLKEGYVYNKARRNFAKLAMNSLSGKVIQRMFASVTKLVTRSCEITKFIENHTEVYFEPLSGSAACIMRGTKKEIKYTQKTAKPCQLGVFIYAYARSHMYRSVISRVEGKYGMDTDSLHVLDTPENLPKEDKHTAGQPRSWFGKFVVGSEFGMFEPEISFKATYGAWIAPKCYVMYNQEGRAKYRFKGVGSRAKLARMSPEQHKELSIQNQHEEYKKLPPALNVELYKRLAAGEAVQVITSQLKKTLLDGIAGKYFSLNQVFTYKTITPSLE